MRIDWENSITQLDILRESLPSRMEQVEDRLSELKDKVIELTYTCKEYEKNKAHKKNMQELLNTMKTSNFQIIGPDEGEEFQLSGVEHIFNKIKDENVSNVRKNIVK